MFIRGAPIIDR